VSKSSIAEPASGAALALLGGFVGGPSTAEPASGVGKLAACSFGLGVVLTDGGFVREDRKGGVDTAEATLCAGEAVCARGGGAALGGGASGFA
jgi:hypothetical protein